MRAGHPRVALPGPRGPRLVGGLFKDFRDESGEDGPDDGEAGRSVAAVLEEDEGGGCGDGPLGRVVDRVESTLLLLVVVAVVMSAGRARGGSGRNGRSRGR